MARSPLATFIVNHQHVLTTIDFSKEIFMIPERMVASSKTVEENKSIFEITTLCPIYKDKLFVFEDYYYAIDTYQRIDNRNTEYATYRVVGEPTGIIFDPKQTTPLATPQDAFILEPGEILNFKETSPIETTIGIFLANYLFLVYPFGDIIPYLNEEFTEGKLKKRIQIPLLKGDISVSDFKDKYVNTLSLFGQSNEIFCPNISEKTITIPKEIHDLRKRLVEENREELEAGNASVMSDIEQKLIKAYKEYLKGDPSMHFLLKSKYFNVTLKKLFLTQGMTEIFGSPGKFKFIENPMGNGWKQEDLPYIFNEVRQGSYSRAIETADGGVIAKLILRVLQDTQIIPHSDCKTSRGEHVHGNLDQIKEFVWNYTINPDGSNTLITDENASDFVSKDVVIRTPGYCQATKGFCAKCFGYVFEELGVRAFAPIANDFGRNQLTASLKRMHGSSHSTVYVGDINKYLI